MNSDQWKGRIDILRGMAKELIGVALRRPALRGRGQREQTCGHARASYGRAVEAVVRRSH